MRKISVKKIMKTFRTIKIMLKLYVQRLFGHKNTLFELFTLNRIHRLKIP